ncbi:unnamed protein product [Larinioides sclopetarius]|uniref:Trafficking protein particle complex subunit 8 n=1 Tax=Larinioides sclopetarius TaxID=280406 RepID=A0AAV1ZCM4_9ARAC
MATCKQTAFELIQDVFSPCIAVLCSSDVEQICAKNNLTFVQMVQPFCRLNTEASTPWFEAYREVFFQVTSSPEHEFVHNYLSCIFVVSSSHQDPLSQINELSQQLTQHQNTHSSRWFFSYVFTYYLLLHDVSSDDLGKAEAVYQSMKSSFGATSCHLLQINSIPESAQTSNNSKDSNDTVMADPWSQFLPKYYVQNNISNNQTLEENSTDVTDENKTGDSSSKSMQESGSIHHPLLYNSDTDVISSDSLLGNSLEDISSGYTNKLSKSNCKMKRHGLCLTQSDMDRIKCFVQDYCIQGLIPFIEKRVRLLNEQVANRKGLHRTLFGVTKKFFGNKPGIQSPASSLNSVVYGPDAPELQVRKLGDLAFMFQLYEVAYQAYHNAKRDFNADQAWLHFAGASEMAALSVFMQNSSAHEYPMHYMESAITTYLHTCKLPELATRATFLSTECLKSKSLYSEAAIQFVRMPSEADLPSALCLEQAAYCYIHCKIPKIRKFAFHIILAGHRFSKAGQRKHALRSYKQAEQVYRSLGWNFANNHINFTIGRLSVQLDQLESACSAFEPLLVSKCELPADEQANYLREYLFVLKRLLSQNAAKELPVLPVPLIISEATKVLLSEDNTAYKDESLCVNGRGFDRGDINNNVWNKLEEIIITRISNNAICHNNLNCFSNKTDNTAKPNAIVGEIISIEVVLKNPLSVALTIEDVYPLWVFMPQAETGSDETSHTIKNEPGFSQTYVTDYIETIVLPKVMIEPHQEKKIHLLITPKQIGELVVTGIAYKLLALKSQDIEQNLDSVTNSPSSILSLQGKQCFSIRGSRLNRTTEERASKAYAQDNRLNINVLSSMAKLQVKFHSFPYSLFCGEVQKVTAQLTNVGQHKLHRIIMASPRPGLFAIGNPGEVNDSESILKEISSSRQPSPVIAKWEADWMAEVLMSDGESCVLEPGSSLEIPVWFKGPETPGDHALDILFYYESEPSHPKLRYRVLQLSTVLVTYPVVSVQSHAMRSFCPEEKLCSFHPAALPSSLILSVEVANTSEELNQVSLVQISCISKDWCFLPSEDNCRKGLPVIHSEESLMLTLKAIGFDPKVTVSSQKVKVFSHIPMGRVEVDNSSTPCIDFSQKSSLDLSSIVPDDHNPLSLPSVKECDKLRIEQDMILLVVIIWKAKVNRDGEERIVIGLHHVPIFNLDPSNVEIKTPSVEAEDMILENEESEVDQLHSSVPSDLAVTAMLKCSLTHPFQVLHNFSEKRIIVIPVEFVVRSTSDIELTVVIDNLSHLESSGACNPEDGCSHLVQRFTWVNGTKRELQVKPHNTVQVSLQAMFCAPGTYNLGNLNILVNAGKDNLFVYPLPPYLLIINSSCTT